MSETFDKLTLRGYIVRGDLMGAMEYLKGFPEQGLLNAFLREADGDHPGNGHTVAAERIAAGFEKKLGRSRGSLADLPVKDIQTTALALFRESTEEMERKYSR